MSITKNQVIAVLPQILTQEIREVIQRGVEAGLAFYGEREFHNRSELGDYVLNIQTRDLYSSICKKLEDTIRESDTVLQAKSQKKTSSAYIEITSPNLVMHLRNETSSLPLYARDKLEANARFAADNRNYIQLAYKASNGQVLEEVSYLVMNEKEEEIYREVINGSWNENILSA